MWSLRRTLRNLHMVRSYERSPKFRGYVERYRKAYGLTVEGALSHALVREVEGSFRDGDGEKGTASANVPREEGT